MGHPGKNTAPLRNVGAYPAYSLPMHHIIYLSYATVPFGKPQLEWLLTQARTFNASHQVTGILLYGNEQFLQVLEGEEQTLRSLYDHIRQDPRHRDVTTFADKEIPTRAFNDWHMAFQPLAPQQLLEFASYISPAEVQLDRPNLSEADTQLLHLLRSFVQPSHQ